MNQQGLPRRAACEIQHGTPQRFESAQIHCTAWRISPGDRVKGGNGILPPQSGNPCNPKPGNHS